jgi:RNA polymerase sigma-32 factor
VKREEVIEMETRLSGRDIALEAPTDDEDDKFSPIAYLSSDQQEPTKVLEAEQVTRLQSEGLETALGKLDPRSRRIVEARWLANDDGSGATLHTLAEEFGVSAERIRQIETAALKKMKGRWRLRVSHFPQQRKGTFGCLLFCLKPGLFLEISPLSP